MLAADAPWDKAGPPLGALSPRISLAWTAPRTRNCRLPPWESTQSRLLYSCARSRVEVARCRPPSYVS
jgi:hypothetical protein